MATATVTWLDVVLVLIFVTGIGFGFHQGLVRQTLLLFSMYVATVLSAQYYQYPAGALAAFFPTSQEMARLLGFALLLVTLTVTVTWMAWTAYRSTRLPEVFVLDSFLGASLGGIIGLLVVNLALLLVRYAVQVPWPEGSPVKYLLYDGVRHSSLQTVFASSLPLIQAAIAPWLPDGIPTVLKG